MNEKEDVKPDIASLMQPPTQVANLSGARPKLVAGPSRLPSFKAPRDLTLSASLNASFKPVSRQKKTFAPNIPIKKEKGVKLMSSKSEKTIKKSPIKTKSQAGRGKSIKKEKEYVQTKGSLFGDGISLEPTIKRSQGNYHSSHGGSGSGADASMLTRPVININAAYNVDKELEDRKLKEILRDDFIDDGEDDDDAIDNFPVRLPLIDSIGKNSELSRRNDPVVNVKKEIVEDAELLEQRMDGINIKCDPEAPPVQKPQSDISYILSDSNSDFILMQLPSCLPGHPPESSNTGTQDKNASTSDMLESTKKKREVCNIHNLPEGKLGTLKEFESGKVELWLGDHKLYVWEGIKVGFAQDLVYINTDSEKGTGSLSVLGRVKHKLLVTPDFDNLTS